MTHQTQRQYNRSFAGSVGSGMQSLVGGNDRRYYILEHKVNSKYHRIGESQKIIIDQIEIGRDSKCQVRFDESFATLSWCSSLVWISHLPPLFLICEIIEISFRIW